MMTVLKIFGIFVLVYVGLSLLPGGCRKTFLKVTLCQKRKWPTPENGWAILTLQGFFESAPSSIIGSIILV